MALAFFWMDKLRGGAFKTAVIGMAGCPVTRREGIPPSPIRRGSSRGKIRLLAADLGGGRRAYRKGEGWASECEYRTCMRRILKKDG